LFVCKTQFCVFLNLLKSVRSTSELPTSVYKTSG